MDTEKLSHRFWEYHIPIDFCLNCGKIRSSLYNMLRLGNETMFCSKICEACRDAIDNAFLDYEYGKITKEEFQKKFSEIENQFIEIRNIRRRK